jgi:exodeoxyribonuclease-3
MTKSDAKVTLKVASVNVNSLSRAWSKGLKAYLDSTSPDILCLQSTSVPSQSPNTFHLPGYRGYFAYPTTEGQGLGSAIYTKIRPVSARLGFDESEGRILVLEFTKFSVLSVHAPSAGDGLSQLRAKVDEWNPKLATLAAELKTTKPLIIAGDFNVAHREIDVYDAADLESTPGFTPDERGWFDGFLGGGFVDAFRARHPDLQEFTYFARKFGRKGRGRGWRMDYFLVAKGVEIVDCAVDSAPNFSNHLPIVLTIDRDNFLTEVDTIVGDAENEIIVVNTGEVVPPSAIAEKVKRPKKERIDADDLRAILRETRSSERVPKPISRTEFDGGDEKPKKVKVKFDEQEYGGSSPKRKHKKSKK